MAKETDNKPKTIAIVGSADESRADQLKELDFEMYDFDGAKKASKEIGIALADAGYDIVVYSSSEGMIEVEVVEGYLESEERRDASILETYCENIPEKFKPKFSQTMEPRSTFVDPPEVINDDNWETAFYRSISSVDGLLLIGGSKSTLIAGLVAQGHDKPLIIAAKYGGAAKKLWGVLSVDTPEYIIGNALNIMARSNWDENSASKLVSILDEQFKVKEQKVADAEQEREDEIRQALDDVESDYQNQIKEILDAHKSQIDLEKHLEKFTTLATILSVITIFAGFLVGFLGYRVDSKDLIIGMLIVLGGFAGSVGAPIRVLMDNSSALIGEIPNLRRKILFGGVGGVIASLLYLFPQLLTNGSSLVGDENQNVIIWIVALIIAGFVGGYTHDAVLKNLPQLGNNNLDDRK